MEKDFAISQFLSDSDLSSLKVVLKQFFSDFVVSEIDQDGTVVHYLHEDLSTRTDKKEEEEEPCCSLSMEQKSSIEEMMTIDGDDGDASISKGVISTEVGVSIDEKCCVEWMDERRTNWNPSLDPMEIGGNTRIGECQRGDTFHSFIQSTQQVSLMIIEERDSLRKRRHWPNNQPDYCHFTLSKENKDSQYAINLIAKFLGMKATSFGMAGTKDRRAISHQRVSVWRVASERLRQLNLRLRGIRLSNFVYQPQSISLGMLSGNRFSIILRGIERNEEIDRRISVWRRSGFINYFGSQRFGTCGFNTAHVGRFILQGQYESAVRLILCNRSVGSDALANCLSSWNSDGDAKKALSNLKGSLAFASIEAQILRSLAQDDRPYDFAKALLSLPRNNRSLYVHAYQSLFWNGIVSRRFAKFGSQLLSGDIQPKNDGSTIFDVQLPLPSANMKAMNDDGSFISLFVTLDIVMTWYVEQLDADSINPSSFAKLEKDFALGDVTRAIAVLPKDVETEWISYADLNQQLEPGLDDDTAPVVQEGQYSALRLRFSLPPGSYATMALRELTHSDLGKTAQCAQK